MLSTLRRSLFVFLLVLPWWLVGTSVSRAQSLGNAGTLQGVVTDPSGKVISNAEVRVHNPITGYHQQTRSGSDGRFKLTNLPPNSYHFTVKAPGFAEFVTDVSVRTSVPIDVPAALTVAGSQTTVEVEANGSHLVELDPSAHIDADRSQFSKIPSFDPAGGLSQAITYTTGGVAADANGFFHPLGDHAQVSFVVDGQPISDQQSKVFSTQLPTSAIQSMELITGSANAEFGDKTSLVGQITTRSGLGATQMFGSLDSYYGTFGNVGGGASLGYGNERFGNFLTVDGGRSGRFLDTPEYSAFHAKGNNQTIFDRFDFQPTEKDIFHLNLFTARNWAQIPNSYDQFTQDQKQRVLTWNIAPGYQRVVSPHVLLTVNPYIRKDQFNYYPSRDLLNDTPSTQSQVRQLLNYGLRSDLSVVRGRHNIKVGIDLKQTRLSEQFTYGVTDPTFNPVCFDSDGGVVTDPTVTDPGACSGLGYTANTGLQPGLVPFDLTRGGTLFQYRSTHNINQYSAYIQDSITLGNLQLNLGLRGDTYYGLTSDGAASPRAGAAYNIKKTGTVVRFAYSRTFETPFNENLLLSSATGLNGGLAANIFDAASAPPLPVGRRNQFNTGLQQAVGRFLLIDADYFWKFTNNAYDFSTLQNSTITFPISWRKSKLDGVTGRVSTINLHGFQGYWTFGHTRARYFPDQTGGLVPQGDQPTSVFRIDHDQAFQSTLLGRYQRPNEAEWISFSWRYDSGLVAGVADVDEALTLTAAQQVAIGFSCNGTFATYAAPITACDGRGASKLINLPQPGEAQDDHNPPRIAPRHLFNLAIGSDNLFHAEGRKRMVARVEITNLTNKTALYNFLSTFSGTHFVQPRAVIASVGFRF